MAGAQGPRSLLALPTRHQAPVKVRELQVCGRGHSQGSAWDTQRSCHYNPGETSPGTVQQVGWEFPPAASSPVQLPLGHLLGGAPQAEDNAAVIMAGTCLQGTCHCMSILLHSLHICHMPSQLCAPACTEWSCLATILVYVCLTTKRV
jgi:hypothetical protein